MDVAFDATPSKKRFLSVDPALFTLLAIPIVLIAVNRNHFVNFVGGVDHWLYAALQWNFSDLLNRHADTYYCTRLTAYLPGWLLHQFLAPLLAQYVLHIGLYWIGVASLYLTLRRVVGRRSAFLAGLAMACARYYLICMSWDYVDSFGIAYFLSCLFCLTKAAEAHHWRWWLVAAGCLAAAVVIANLLFCVYLPFLGLWFLALNRDGPRRSWLRSCCWLAFGFAFVFLSLGALSWSVNGRFWFITPSVQWSLQHARTYNAGRTPAGWAWVHDRSYLIWPIACSIAAALTLLTTRFWKERPSRAFLCLQLMLPIQLLLFVCLDAFLGFAILNHYYTAGLMIPMCFLALGGQLQAASERVSPRAFLCIAATAVLGSLVAVLLPPHWCPDIRFERTTLGYLPAAAALFGSLVLLRAPLCGRLAVGALAACVIVIAAMPAVPLEELLSPLRMHSRSDLTGDRVAGYVAIHEAAAQIRRHDPAGDTLWWYDAKDPAHALLQSVASTQFFLYRGFGLAFPNPPPSALETLRDGRKLVVLSSDPDAGLLALENLSRVGISARVTRVARIDHPRPIYLTFLDGEAAKLSPGSD